MRHVSRNVTAIMIHNIDTLIALCEILTNHVGNMVGAKQRIQTLGFILK